MESSVDPTGSQNKPLDLAGDTTAIRPPRWRRWRRWRRGLRWGAVLLLALVLLAVGLPSILSLPVCHRIATGRITRDVAGHLEVGRLQLRWWARPVLDELRFVAPDGRPVLELPRCQLSRSLWSLVWDGSTFGELKLEQPTVYLLLDGPHSNLSEAVKPLRVEEVPAHLIKFVESIKRPTAGNILVQHGRFFFQSAPHREMVELSSFGLAATIHPPTAESGPRIEVQPCRLADRVEVSRQLGHHLLKYVAPVLANTTRMQGAFSLDVAEGRIPLDELQQATLRGRLRIHHLAAGAGPLITQLAQQFGVADSIKLVDDSQIEFQLREGAIHHAGLRFQLGPFALATSGFVRLDESIALTVETHFPQQNSRGTTLGAQLAGRVVQLPITGTLSQPRIDWARMAEYYPLLDEWIIQRLQPSDETPLLNALLNFRRQSQEQADPSRTDLPVLRQLFPGVMRTLDATGVTPPPASRPSADDPARPGAPHESP
jgi:hypothetical protein